MGILREFRDFAARGNVADLAVGVVMGAAFGKIVNSAVTDIITPPIGLAIGGVKFSDLKIVLREAVGDKPPVTLNYGSFLQAIFDFIIIAAAIFALVKVINRIHRKPPPEPPGPSREVEILTQIRDALVKR